MSCDCGDPDGECRCEREKKALRDALLAMLRMHERESGHREGGVVCANCFVAREVLR